MRLIRLMALCLLLLTALPLLAANVPLVLTAAIDRDVLLASQLVRDATLLTGIQSVYEIEPAKVTLTFTNTGDAPLKLNAFRLQALRVQLEINGPNSGSVEQEHVADMIDGTYALKEKDFPVLQPGTSWTYETSLVFPSSEFHGTRYGLLRGGDYHLRVLYAYTPNKAELANQTALEEGCYQGAVASNVLAFRLVEASAPVNGLQLALDAQPSVDPLSGDIRLTGYLRNDSAKPITVNAWNLFNDGVQITGDDGKVIPFTGGNDRSRKASLAERYTTLAPGEKHAYTLRGGYRPDLDTLKQQVGNFGMESPTGFFRNWLLPGSTAHASALLEMPEAGEQPADAPVPLWTGKVTSPTIAILLNPTAYRQAKLKQQLAQFKLVVNYNGPQDKPFYSLRLQVPVQEQNDAFNPLAQLTETQASTLIDYLAKSGVLRDATTPALVAASPVPPSGYSLVLSGDLQAGAGEAPYWTLFLGWNLKMYEQLQALQGQLPKDGQAKMDTLLARLSGMHGLWVAEDALRQPLVTLDTHTGTLSDAAHDILAAAQCPSLQLNIDQTTGAIPVKVFHFCNVTPLDALQALAAATDVNCTTKENIVVFHALVN